MDAALDLEVRRRAGGVCEYCRLPESVAALRHVIDHVIACKHGGATSSAKLALCCGRCNLHKGPNISGLDPQTRQLTRLYNPRTDVWADHFRYDGPTLVGLTPEGRCTVAVLAVNDPGRVAVRRMLITVGYFPPP